ncbi:MAG: NADH-quinone oxidoreductase subunit J [Anaerolineae bacterium]|nr:NADH-quinone oxidoreductase subunit J [Anaerolineae bacterium]
MIEFNFITIGFIIFSLIALGGALGVVMNHNLFRGTIWLMVSLFGVAGLFVLLSAPFLAAVQILVYIGAIAILFTFAVMLTRGLTNIRERFVRAAASAVAAGGFFVLLVLGVIWPVWGANADLYFPVSDQTIRTLDLGVALVSGNGFVIPFEVASLLLTAAMIGAIVIAREADDEI